MAQKETAIMLKACCGYLKLIWKLLLFCAVSFLISKIWYFTFYFQLTSTVRWLIYSRQSFSFLSFFLRKNFVKLRAHLIKTTIISGSDCIDVILWSPKDFYEPQWVRISHGTHWSLWCHPHVQLVGCVSIQKKSFGRTKAHGKIGSISTLATRY